MFFMKKIRLTLFSLTFITLTFGQITVGIKSGLNISNTKDIAPPGSSARLGFNAGLLSVIGISKKIIVQPEVLYSVKGYRFPATAFNSNGIASFNYISVPLLFGYRVADKFTILAGPEFNFLTNVNSRFDDTNHDISKNFRKFDLAIDIGLVYNVKNDWGVEVRYSRSFKDLVNGIFTDSNGNETGEKTIGSHRVFQIGLFYKFMKNMAH